MGRKAGAGCTERVSGGAGGEKGLSEGEEMGARGTRNGGTVWKAVGGRRRQGERKAGREAGRKRGEWMR